ncbi:MAG: NAD-dependent epimerase/dehydratase family protein [Actinomycetota bacterium]
MGENGLHIAVTGAAGHLAGALLRRLVEDERIASITAMDLRPVSMGDKVRYVQGDMADKQAVKEALAGADVVAHFAFIVLRPPGLSREQMRRINLGGARVVLEAAAEAGVRRLVVASSTAIYGAKHDSKIFLTEDTPSTPDVGFDYGEDKAALEDLLDKFEASHPEVVVTRFRPSTTGGPHMDPRRLADLAGKTVFLPSNPLPVFQFLHEDDLGAAFHLACVKDLPGPYNVSPDDAGMTVPEALASIGKRVILVPPWVAKPVGWVLWKLGKSVLPPGWITIQDPVVSNARLKAAGWQPKYASMETFYQTVEAMGIGKRPSA